MGVIDDYKGDRLLHPKPLIDDWNKLGGISTKKVQDWMACGGSRNGNYVASANNFDQIQRCMLKKSYHMGKCENESNPWLWCAID